MDIAHRVFLLFLLASQSACSVFGARSEETPRYEVLQTDGNKEIRTYSAYIVAKTEVSGDFETSQEDAFRILAGYIFGGNQSKVKMAMTAPVEQTASVASEKIAMTAPVEQSKSETGWVMTFMMPSKYQLEDLPVPNDSRIKFERVEARPVAVIRYSGSRSEAANAKKSDELRAWIQSLGKYEIVGPSRSAGYDPPWTLPPFRRNEMMFDVKLKTP